MTPEAFLAELLTRASSSGDDRFASRQLLRLYEKALARPGGVFLELGTDRGQASRAILAACQTNGGSLVSVDIRDCSQAVSSPCWTFVQADSTDRVRITSAAPVLEDGIDFVYVDSLHTAEHVTREVYAWFPLVKDGGFLFFDDVDSGPYLSGERKDNPRMEIDNRCIRQALESIFYSNREVMDFSLEYGSTGLAVIEKRGGELKPARRHPQRNSMLLARIRTKLGLERYTHKSDGTDFVVN